MKFSNTKHYFPSFSNISMNLTIIFNFIRLTSFITMKDKLLQLNQQMQRDWKDLVIRRFSYRLGLLNLDELRIVDEEMPQFWGMQKNFKWNRASKDEVQQNWIRRSEIFGNWQFSKSYDSVLYDNRIGVEGAKQLANLQNLKTLSLGSNKIFDEGIKHLANGNFQNRLNNIGAEGANYLGMGKLNNLKEFWIDHNNIGTEGAKYLASGNFHNLTRLYLVDNNIGSQGAYLATSNLSKLTTLQLWYNKIGLEGVKYLAAGNLFNITTLSLGQNNIEEPKKAQLRLLFKQNNQIKIYL